MSISKTCEEQRQDFCSCRLPQNPLGWGDEQPLRSYPSFIMSILLCLTKVHYFTIYPEFCKQYFLQMKQLQVLSFADFLNNYHSIDVF
jgi:hypothetical protein